MTDYKCLLYEVKDAIATLTLNRPERLNALGGTLRDDLYAAVLRASQDAAVRVIVVTGAGKGFCACGDVKAMNEVKEGRAERPLIDKVAPLRDRVLLAMRDAPQPVIAAVNGAAAGVGMAKACELIFTGDIIDAGEALRLGLVSAVYAPEELLPATHELARKIAAGPPIAIRLAKRALYHSQDVDLRAALEFETFAQNIASETEDAREGIRAFVEKRPATFKGR